MTCDETRDALLATARDRVAAAAVAAHLRDCAACARFAERLAATRAVLAEERLAVEPDAGFSARVVAALPNDTQLVGWAALRLLPAALGLLAALTWVGFREAPSPAQALLGGGSPETLLVWSAVAPVTPEETP